MPDYRLYCLDGAGRISLADWIEADSDQQAMKSAREATGRAQVRNLATPAAGEDLGRSGLVLIGGIDLVGLGVKIVGNVVQQVAIASVARVFR